MFLSCVSVGVTIILDNASFYRKKKLSLIVERLVLVCCFCLRICLILTVLSVGGLIWCVLCLI